MAGWRDVEGRTSRERRGVNAAAERRSFIAQLRHRPASLVRPLLGFLFVTVLVIALINFVF
jgi:hypothetical protein